MGVVCLIPHNLISSELWRGREGACCEIAVLDGSEARISSTGGGSPSHEQVLGTGHRSSTDVFAGLIRGGDGAPTHSGPLIQRSVRVSQWGPRRARADRCRRPSRRPPASESPLEARYAVGNFLPNAKGTHGFGRLEQ